MFYVIQLENKKQAKHEIDNNIMFVGTCCLNLYIHENGISVKYSSDMTS